MSSEAQKLRTEILSESSPSRSIASLNDLIQSTRERGDKSDVKQWPLILDQQLFSRIIDVALEGTSLEVISLCLQLLNETMETKSLMQQTEIEDAIFTSIHKKIELFELLSLKFTANNDKFYHECTSFLFNLFSRLIAVENTHAGTSGNSTDLLLIPFIRLRDSGLINSIGDVIEDRFLSNDVKESSLKVKSVYDSAIVHLKSTYPSSSNSLHASIIAELVVLLSSLLAVETGHGGEKSEAWAKIGVRTSIEEELSNLPLIDLLDLLSFLKDENLTFKKKYTEQLMFSSADHCMPLIPIGHEISNMLYETLIDATGKSKFIGIHLSKYSTGWCLMYFYTMNFFLEIWKQGKAEYGDLHSSIELVRVVFKRISDSLTEHSTIDDITDIFEALHYDEARTLQVQSINIGIKKAAGGSIELLENESFSESKNFVKEQRVISLMKGAWILAENPLALQDSSQSPAMYYMSLSSDRKLLQYQRYNEKPTTLRGFRKACSTINVSTIGGVEIQKLEPQESHKPKVIHLNSRRVYTKITLVSKDKSPQPLLVFYTDTSEQAYEWGDGLELITKGDSVSKDTKDQIELMRDIKMKYRLSFISKDSLSVLTKSNGDSHAGEDMDDLDQDMIEDFDYFYS